MKLPKHFSGKAKSPREPLRTHAEVAEGLGLTGGQLKAYARMYPGFPEARLRFAGTYSSKPAIYFQPSLVKAWWLTVLAARAATGAAAVPAATE